MIDLRSDTVTRPGESMRRAMYEAEVGDDVFGEDPTVRRLQETVAELLGKERALFVPSGVMGNQLAIRVHTSPGDEVLCEAGCHVANYESGAPGVLSGVQLRTIQGTRGILTADQVESAIRPGAYWEPQPRLVTLENTHNKAGGVVQPRHLVEEIAAVARRHRLATHLDGARIWNAAVRSGVAEAELAAPFDTVSVCLSKGLGAPVGSVLAGPEDLVERAHRFRKMWGGGMRQAGILAAAGLYALEHHRGDLALDHERARRLAAGIAEIGCFRLDPDSVETNIVMFDVVDAPAGDVLSRLRAEGVLMVPFGPRTIRATVHRDLGDGDIDAALEAMRRLFA
jgi:threonine aldolase